MAVRAVFRGLCPNCGGDVTSERLVKGLPCVRCLPPHTKPVSLRDGYLHRVLGVEDRVREVNEMFRRAVGSGLWGLQRLWARRFFSNESFAMVAPTGSGKTTMQIILAIHAALNGRKSLILVPTSLLARQIHEKVSDICGKLGLNGVKLVSYHSLMSEKAKRESVREVCDASIIITTSASLMKRPELQQHVDVAFVDDVDSFLRRSKSVDIVLRMLGVTENEEKVVSRIQELEDMARRLATERPDEARRLISEALKMRTALQSNTKGSIVVSGATQTARRTKSVRLLNTLYGFTVGGKIEVGRNIVDTYVRPEGCTVEEVVARVVRKLGGGGLIYVPMDKGVDYARRLAEFLKGEGLRAEAYLGSRKRVFDQFVSGELDVLVGVASYRSPLTRGIDLPERVRYAVFAGVPKFRLRISVEDFQPGRWLILLNEIKDAIYSKYPEEFDRVLGGLVKIRTSSRDVLEVVREALKSGRELAGYQDFVRRVAEEALSFMNRVLKDPDVIDRLSKSRTIAFGGREGEYFFIIPDATAYIQASGRTSRLYVGGLTKGLSVLVIDEEKAFNALLRDLKWLLEAIEFREYRDDEVEGVMKEVDRDRRRVRLALEGRLRVRKKELMKTALFIVESPNKARTIARLFGRPARKTVGSLQTFEVLSEDRLIIVAATGGHILDLVTDAGRFGVLVRGSSFMPVYKPIRRCVKCGRDVPEDEDACPSCGGKTFVESRPIIDSLRHIATQVDEVLVGTDPDAEGEKIAWDVTLLLKPFNNSIHRVRFHEVTRRGIYGALASPSAIDNNMVDAQIVRRIEDRWIGFSLSPMLWRKFKLKFLSAGRVQTPVLGWVVERTDRYRVKADLITVVLKGVDVPLIFKAPRNLAKRIKDVGRVVLKDFRREVVEIHPPPPYTTDTMLSEASRVLRTPALRVMESAQRLFEAGLITYHRTDSTTVSPLGISIARDYVSRVFGDEVFQGRRWERPGAHECIRPTRPLDSKQVKALRAAGLLSLAVPLRADDYRLYDLVFRRFIMSQMRPSKVERTSFKLVFEDFMKEFTLITKVIEDGFSRMNRFFNVVDLSGVSDGEYEVSDVESRTISEYPLYTYSDLVDLMKSKGIGRPSTYAKILDTLKRRGYVIEVGKGRLVATTRGREVFRYLNEKFNHLVNEERTKKLQEKIDLIEAGSEKACRVLREFYDEIKSVEKLEPLESSTSPLP
ncbi:MAG: reverse gyrase [Zestosphaera sp.]